MHSHHHHDHHHVHSAPVSDEPALRFITRMSILCAATLVCVKIGGWYYTHSLSMLSSLVDSLFDVVMSGINFFALRYALKPADDDHRFGHSSIEDIAGLAQFAFISGSMFFLVIQSVQRLLEPVAIEHSGVGMGIMGFSILVTGALVIAQRIIAKRTGSLIVAADALHYVGDLLMNAVVLLSFLLISMFGWLWLDPVLALCVAVYVQWEAFGLGKRAFNNLMDHEMPDDQKKVLDDIICKHPGVKGYHQLKTRYSGSRAFIQFHVDLDGSQSLFDSHKIADALEAAIEKAFPNAEVIAHQDPV